MSRHTLVLPTATKNKNLFVVVGYHEIADKPSLFCIVFNYPSTNDENEQWLFNSMFSPGYTSMLSPHGFDAVLKEHGAELPAFIKAALQEDIDKRRINSEFAWTEEGFFEQVS